MPVVRPEMPVAISDFENGAVAEEKRRRRRRTGTNERCYDAPESMLVPIRIWLWLAIAAVGGAVSHQS